MKLFNYSVLSYGGEPFIGKNVVIYGRSLSALKELIYLEANGINVEAVTDSNAKEEDGYFAGITICSLEEKDK